MHEWKDRIIYGPPVGSFSKTIVHLKQLRGRCHLCDDGIRSAKIDFVHPHFQNYTMALCEYAGRLMEEMTCEAVARLLRLNPKTMWDRLKSQRSKDRTTEHKMLKINLTEVDDEL